MKPKYIRLETLRQKQAKELGGNISLFDLATNLKEMERPLFVHNQYIVENNIYAFIDRVHFFAALRALGLPCYRRDIDPILNLSIFLSLSFSKANFFEIESYNIERESISSPKIVLWGYTADRLSEIISDDNNTSPEIVNTLLLAMYGEPYSQQNIIDKIGHLPKPRWGLVKPTEGEPDFPYTFENKNYLIAKIPYSELYVLNDELGDNSNQQIENQTAKNENSHNETQVSGKEPTIAEQRLSKLISLIEKNGNKIISVDGDGWITSTKKKRSGYAYKY